MRAILFRLGAPDDVVGSATWDGREVEVEANDDDVRASIRRIFRPIPVVIDDRSTRPPGATGPTVLQPGDLQWFQAAARTRSTEEGLGVRISTEHPGGWDPAGAPLVYGWSGLMVTRERHGR